MGIYVHVPFCRSKCFYCGFYSVASLKLKEAYLGAIGREIDLRRGYLQQQEMHTLYFGEVRLLTWSVGSWNESYGN